MARILSDTACAYATPRLAVLLGVGNIQTGCSAGSGQHPDWLFCTV